MLCKALMGTRKKKKITKEEKLHSVHALFHHFPHLFQNIKIRIKQARTELFPLSSFSLSSFIIKDSSEEKAAKTWPNCLLFMQPYKPGIMQSRMFNADHSLHTFIRDIKSLSRRSKTPSYTSTDKSRAQTLAGGFCLTLVLLISMEEKHNVFFHFNLIH